MEEKLQLKVLTAGKKTPANTLRINSHSLNSGVQVSASSWALLVEYCADRCCKWLEVVHVYSKCLVLPANIRLTCSCWKEKSDSKEVAKSVPVSICYAKLLQWYCMLSCKT